MKHTPLLLLVAVALSSLLAHAQPESCPRQTGTTTRETYSSRLLGQPMVYTAYTPPCYDAQAEPYPALYLMHGSNEDDGHWLRLGIVEALDAGIASGSLPPMVVILPFGNVIANRNLFEGFSWNNIFLQELLPHVEVHYNVAQDSARRAIGGISRGGFWAYQIALSHPQRFSAVGGHSAFFDEFHAPPEHNPLHLASDAPDLETLRLWLDHGTEDFAAPGLRLMHERLTARGLEHTYRSDEPGQHNNDYWSRQVADYLQFYAQDWHDTPPTLEQPATSAPSAFITNTPAVPAEAPTHTPTASGGVLLFPAVAFPSLQTSISRQALLALKNGALDPNLLLTETTAQQFQQHFAALHPDTRIVPDEALRAELWQNRTAYTLLPLEALSLDVRILFVDDVPVADQLPGYPLATTERIDTLTRITFSGVTALTRNTRLALDEQGLAWAADGILPYVSAVDYFHMSNEVSIVPGCPQSSRPLLGGASSFCTNPEHMELLPMLEVDIVELTGNHNNDYGYEAYRNTLAFYDARDIATVGGGETLEEARTPLLLEHNGNRIGMLACNVPGPYYAQVNEDETLLGGVRPGAAPCDWEWLEAAIPRLAQDVDVLIVSVQHEEIEDYRPTSAQQRDFRRMADLGADVVIGTAAHKPQTFEFYATRGTTAFIHYGLGNLYFDQPFWGNMRFFLDTLYIAEGELRGLEIFPGIIDDSARPRLMTADERENFLFFMLVEQNGL